MSTRTLVFVHGNFVTKRCWDPWIARFTPRGYTCHAIEYPLRDGTVAELRAKHPDPALGRLGPDGKVDFAKVRSPLLLVAGEVDHIMPAALVRAVYKRYAASLSITEYKEFPGRSHHILNQRGWEEVADYVVEWATEKAGVGPELIPAH